MANKGITLPKFIYEHDSSVNNIVNEQEDFYLTEKVTVEGGIKLYLRGVPWPQKGLTDPHALWALNMAKRYLIEPIKLMTKMPFLASSLVFCVLTYKAKVRAIQDVLSAYVRIAYGPLEGFILKREYLCPIAQEIQKITNTFLLEIGIDEHTSGRMSKITSHFLEYDNAYRYRVQDLFSETTKEALLKDPVKEMKRLLQIMSLRDDNIEVKGKFRSLVMILSFALFSRKIKKALINAIKGADIERMGFDGDDEYWVCMRTDYKFFGKEYDERMKMVEDEPKPLKISAKDVHKYV